MFRPCLPSQHTAMPVAALRQMRANGRVMVCRHLKQRLVNE